MHGAVCCPSCLAPPTLVDSQQGPALKAAPADPHPSQLVLPGFGESVPAKPSSHDRSRSLAERIAAAEPDLMSSGVGSATSAASDKDSTPPGSLKSGEYELVERPVSLAALEANLPRPHRRPPSEGVPPPAGRTRAKLATAAPPQGSIDQGATAAVEAPAHGPSQALGSSARAVRGLRGQGRRRIEQERSSGHGSYVAAA